MPSATSLKDTMFLAGEFDYPDRKVILCFKVVDLPIIFHYFYFLVSLKTRYCKCLSRKEQVSESPVTRSGSPFRAHCTVKGFQQLTDYCIL